LADLKARMTEFTWERTAMATLDAYRWALADRRAERRIDGARRFATLAHADELLADPDLLRAYGEAFSADDDATLVIYAPNADPADIEGRLVELVGSVGMGEEGAADLLALPFPARAPDESALAAGVDAVLSPNPPRAAFAGVRHYDQTSIGELRAAAG
jgi:hypothetical protein